MLIHSSVEILHRWPWPAVVAAKLNESCKRNAFVRCPASIVRVVYETALKLQYEGY